MSRILVIDDEPHLRELLRSFLVLDGHDVVTAENGMDGLKLAAVATFDLVVTDIIMPETDGFEVVQALAGKPGTPKIICITGGSRNLDSDYLLKLSELMGALKVLRKPVSYENLSEAVYEVLLP
jgi:CheY-like chemotaxis protein